MARPRTPSYLKVVRGTDRPDRANAAEPKPRRERPSPPSHLSDRGKAAWAEVSLLTDGMGVLTEADLIALEGFAETIGSIRAAYASLALPMTMEDEDGTLKTIAEAGERYYWSGPMRRSRPELSDIADLERRLAMWCAKFGLSPADRSRVSSAPKKDFNPFADLG